MFSLHFRTYPTLSSQNCPSENTALIHKLCEIFEIDFSDFKHDGVIAKRSRVKENDSNDSDFPLKLMEKTTNSMDI